MAKATGLTAAQEILLGAAALAQDGKTEFSEWDLTVAVWRRNPNKFGCRGYEDHYPDHKRVMMEIMGKKKENPLQRGWMEKARANYYRMTALGMAEADRLTSISTGSQPSAKSAERIYDAVKKYVFHRSFLSYLENEDEPRTWLGAAAFWELNEYSPDVLEKRMRAAKDATSKALNWLDAEGKESFKRGPAGGGKDIKRVDLLKLRTFIAVLEQRFAVQINGIRAKAS